MGFGQLEDLEGSFELVIFSEPFEQNVELLRIAKNGSGVAGEVGPIPLIIHGTLEEGDPPKILVRDVTRLDHAEEKLSASLRLASAGSEGSRLRWSSAERLIDSLVDL